MINRTAVDMDCHRPTNLPALPGSWGDLDWQQLTACWRVKIRYGGNPDMARVAALTELLGVSVLHGSSSSPETGERIYRLRGKDGRIWTVTAREAAHMAKKAMPWFDYPYGDHGEEEVKDGEGNVVRERREPVAGYVGPMRDALALPVDEVKVGSRHFSLPQVAGINLSWQQYRSLQAVAAQLFQDGMTEDRTVSLQAQFLAQCLVPRSLALLDTAGGSIRLRLHWEYRYDAGQADSMAAFWERKIRKRGSDAAILFHICFQVYQTALSYYAAAYPLLFTGEGGKAAVRDALQGEVGTINAVMKYAGYAEQQQVYDSNLPNVLDILNTMAKEAHEIEKMNAKIKKK